MDRSLLPDQSPFDLMDREAGRIEAFLAPLVDAGDDEPGWHGPTRCSEWDVRALFSHLRHLEDYNQACVNGTVTELRGGVHYDDFNAVGVRQYAGVAVAELFEQWRALNADYRARMRERGDGVVDTSVGDYPSLIQGYYLAVEYATHGDDVGISWSYEGRDAWRAAFTRFACVEQEKPLTFNARDGSTLVDFEGRTYDVTDHDLAEAGVGRLPAYHTMPDALRSALRCCA